MKKSSKRNGGGHKALRSSGSPRHTEMVGPGEFPGAGETEAVGSGKSRETRGSMPDSAYPSRTIPAAGNIPKPKRGQEEDGD